MIARRLFLGFLLIGTAAGGRLALEHGPDRESIAAAPWDSYDPQLNTIDTLDKAEREIRATLPPQATDWQKAAAVDHFMRLRFFHGFANYSPRSNWLAWGAGRFRFDLAAIVLPDDILKHRMAMCSQNSIVFQALLERLGIHHGSLRWTHKAHFTTAALIGGYWLAFDANQEPAQIAVPLEQLKGQVTLGDIDRNPAPHAALFDRITKALSKWLWLLPLTAAILVYKRKPA